MLCCATRQQAVGVEQSDSRFLCDSMLSTALSWLARLVTLHARCTAFSWKLRILKKNQAARATQRNFFVIFGISDEAVRSAVLRFRWNAHAQRALALFKWMHFTAIALIIVTRCYALARLLLSCGGWVSDTSRVLCPNG